MSLLGTVSGKFTLDISQAVAAYAAARAANAETVTAMEKSASSFNMLGNAFLGAGLGIAAALFGAADEAGKFNQQMDYFQSISGATVSQMDAIKKKAIELDQTTMFSTSDIAAMFVQLAKSGESTQTILGGVADACVALAQAAQVPLSDATNDVVVTMSAFNLQASQATEVANLLAGAANSSTLNLSDLSAALKYVGGAANQLGVSLPDTVSALDLLGKAGITGSMGGTELRQIMVSLSAPTAAATKEMKSLGLITKNNTNLFFDQSGNLKDLGTVFQLLQGKLAGMTAEQQSAALKTLFNNRAISASAILTKDGAAGFAEMNAQIAKTTAASTAAAQMDNLQGDIKKLTSSVKTLAITAGQPLQDFLRQTVQNVTKLVQAFSQLSPQAQTNIIHILAYTSAILVTLGALSKFIAFILTLTTNLKKLGTAFGFIFDVLEALFNVLKGVVVALADVLDPVTLVITIVLALGAAFYELYEHVTVFRDAMNDVGRSLKGAFESALNWFKGLAPFFENMWNDIKHVFDEAVAWIVQAWDSIVNEFEKMPGQAVHYLSEFGDMIASFFEAIPGVVSRGLTTALNAVEHFFERLPYYAGYAIGYTIGLFLRLVIELVVLTYRIGKEVVGAIINFFEKLPGQIEDALDDAWHATQNWWDNMVRDVEKYGSEFFEAIINWFEQLPTNLENWLDEAWHAVQNWWDNLIRDAEKDGTEFLVNLISFFEQLPTKIEVWLAQAYNNVKNWITNCIVDIGQFGMNMFTSIQNWFGKLPGYIGQIFNNAINAIESAIGSAFSAAANFASGLWNGFKHGLGIHSPSFIEKSMFAITDTMDTETGKINRYVKQIQGLGSQLQDYNPATVASAYSSGQMTALGNSMSGQLSQLQALRKALGDMGTGYTLSSAANSGGSALGSSGAPTKVLEVNVYNPVAESTASSATQQLRTLASMGAF